MILREKMQQVLDVMVVIFIKDCTSSPDTSFKAGVGLKSHQAGNVFKARSHLQVSFFAAVVNEFAFVFEELLRVVNSISEDTTKFVASPLDTVFNLVREVAHGAHGDRFFWRVLDVSVTERLVWNDHLRVGLGSEGSRFKEWFLKPYAFAINVVAGLDVVDGIDNEIKG